MFHSINSIAHSNLFQSVLLSTHMVQNIMSRITKLSTIFNPMRFVVPTVGCFNTHKLCCKKMYYRLCNRKAWKCVNRKSTLRIIFVNMFREIVILMATTYTHCNGYDAILDFQQCIVFKLPKLV